MPFTQCAGSLGVEHEVESANGVAVLSARIAARVNKIPNSPAIRHLESSTEISGNLPSRSGVREVGILLNKSAQADAVGHDRPVEGIPVL
jgi:hypothetical protein